MIESLYLYMSNVYLNKNIEIYNKDTNIQYYRVEKKDNGIEISFSVFYTEVYLVKKNKNVVTLSLQEIINIVKYNIEMV